jgi:AcrR family transcriptional regulator
MNDLDSAVEVFNERGYESTSTDELSRRLGIAASKEELLRLALDHALEGLSEAAGQAQALDAPAIDRLEVLVRGAVAVLESRLPYVILLLRVRGDTDIERSAVERRRSFDALVASLVSEAERDGDIPADVDPKATARLLFGMINSIADWHRSGNHPASLADTVCEVVFDGLRARR